MFPHYKSVIRAAAVATIVGGFAFAAAPGAMAQTQPPVAAPAKPVHAKVSPVDRVESRITDLHNRLKVTSDQETLWSAVAKTMRDNAQAVDAVLKQRGQNVRTMTAVDDLASYQALAQAHADGLKNLTAAFDALYASMPDAQKANADAVFRHFEHRPGPRAAHKAHAPGGAAPAPAKSQ